MRSAYQSVISTIRTLSGFPRSTRARYGWGWVSSIPRGRRCPHGRSASTTVACRFSTARSLSARHSHPTRTVSLTRHQQGFPVSHPMPAFPSPVTPGRSRDPWVFPWASHPTGQDRPRTPRRGRVTDTDPRSRHRHRSTSNRRTRLQRATSRRNARKRCTCLSSIAIFANRIVPGQVHLAPQLRTIPPGVSHTHLNPGERQRPGPLGG